VLKTVTVAYASGVPTATFEFASAVANPTLITPTTGWTAALDTDTKKVKVTGTAAAGVTPVKLTVKNNSDSKTTTVEYDVPGSETVAAGTYTIVAYGGGDTVTLKDASGTEKLYYIGGTDAALKNLIETIYTPNAPGTTDTVETNKTAIAYTTTNKATVSDKVLGLFKIVVPASGGSGGGGGSGGSGTGTLKVNITGTDLPTEAGASTTNLIVIDIGKPGVDNSPSGGTLPTFYIPNQGLGAQSGSYGHIRLRVNEGASLVIEADNTGYTGSGGGAGHPCPNGYFNGGCVEVMSGGKLRDGAYEGFPLGANAVILNRYGSSLSVGPESVNNSSGTPDYDKYYKGVLVGPSSDNARIQWDTATEDTYLEVRPGKIATNAKLTVKKSVGLIYSVWFVDNASLTIDVTSSGDEIFSNGNGGYIHGLMSREDAAANADYNFYGNSATSITISSGSFLDKRFLEAGARDLVAADILSSTTTISAPTTGASVEYEAGTGITGILISYP
jgi:hypothetical protein